MSCGADEALTSGQICVFWGLSLYLGAKLVALFLDQHKKVTKEKKKTRTSHRNSFADSISLWNCTGDIGTLLLQVGDGSDNYVG